MFITFIGEAIVMIIKGYSDKCMRFFKNRMRFLEKCMRFKKQNHLWLTVSNAFGSATKEILKAVYYFSKCNS